MTLVTPSQTQTGQTNRLWPVDFKQTNKQTNKKHGSDITASREAPRYSDDKWSKPQDTHTHNNVKSTSYQSEMMDPASLSPAVLLGLCFCLSLPGSLFSIYCRVLSCVSSMHLSLSAPLYPSLLHLSSRVNEYEKVVCPDLDACKYVV